MAPVGSRESLAAAFQAGADSVYFGIGTLNMRSKSANEFTIDDLKEIASLCAERGVKSYLTVNTVIYDEDLPLMRQIVDAAKEAKISAVIASDAAVMMYCKQKGVEVHLSTQLNISNVEALKFYSQFADVVVLARELNLRQVKRIYDEIQQQRITGPKGDLIRIEMFCHGALCMAVSGKCYLSLNNAGKSANRGACMQTCRRAYIVKDKERDVELEIDNQYIMSPKDLKTIGFMDQMIKAGVRVFKIEGRARGPEYVRTVVEAYDQAIRQALTVNGMKRSAKPGMLSWRPFITAAFGAVIISVRLWANGATVTVHRRLRERFTPVRGLSIFPKLRLPNFWCRRLNLMPEISFSLPVRRQVQSMPRSIIRT